jgi:hypothetical protein
MMNVPSYAYSISNDEIQTSLQTGCSVHPKLWRSYHLTDDQARDVAKEVRCNRGLARP